MSRLGIGLIGYGYWGVNHARVVRESPDATLVAVFDETAERVRQAQTRLGIPGSTGVKEIFGRSDVDAVIIATPASSHYTLARAALEAGQHVLLEKPMALEVAECESLCELAARRGRVLMVGHTFLYNTAVQAMKRYVRAPEFGKVYYLNATRTNLGPIRADVDAVWDLSPHDIAIFDFLLDQTPVWVSAAASKVLGNSRYDVAFITLGYPNNVMANIHVSWVDPNKVRQLVAIGSQRRIVFDDTNDLERLRIFEKGVAVEQASVESYGEFKLLMRDGDILSPRLAPSEPLKNQLADFVAAIREERPPVSDGQVGLRVVRTLCAIDAALKTQARKEI